MEDSRSLVSLVNDILVPFGAISRGTLGFGYGFDVEAAGDSPVWHTSAVEALMFSSISRPLARRGRRRLE